MNLQEYRQLQAEKSALEKLLAGLPVDRAIERIGLMARKDEVEDLLASQTIPNREPLHARLIFRGKPIIANHGIFAEFGALVINTFTEAVATLGASHGRELGSRGVVPKRDDFKLMITGTALGSFGFEFEEIVEPGQLILPLESTPLEMAMERTKAILHATLGTDEELTEAISETDPRALEKIRKFLETMADNETVCSFEFKGDVFRFKDVGQLRRSMNRLGEDNIHENEETRTGMFLGVLPNRRTFEFRVAETNEILTGKVGTDIVDAASINHVLEKPVTIAVKNRRVGEGRPRYNLLSYQEKTNDGE